MTYNVIAYETTVLTYQIEADSPQSALDKYSASEHPSEDFGEPDEALLGVDDFYVEGHPEADTRPGGCERKED